MANRGRHRAKPLGSNRNTTVPSSFRPPREQQHSEEHLSAEHNSPIQPSGEASNGSPFEQPPAEQTPQNVVEDDTLDGSTPVRFMSDGREDGSEVGMPSSSSRSYTHQTEVVDDGSTRKILEIFEGRFIGGHVSHEITKLIKSFFPGAYPCWKEVPDERKDVIFDKFKESFSWRGVNDAHVREIWNDVATQSYSRALFYARKVAKKKSRDHTLIGARDHPPTFIKTPIWHELIDKYWNNDTFTKKCETASRNRKTLKDGKVPTHTGGSINFVTVWKGMEKELKRPIGRCEVYLRTHKKNKGTGEFVDKAGELVYEKYKELVTQVHGESAANDTAFYDKDLWQEATGGEKKGKVYGQISPYDFGNRRGSGSLSTSSSSTQESEALEERIRDEMKKEMVDKLDEQKRQFEEKMTVQEERLKEREKKMQEEQEQLKKQVETLMEAFSGMKK